MAGDWIKFETVTPDKPEIHKIAEILGIDSDAVVGKILRFWIWADQQAVNGNALSVTKTFIDRITYASGFAEAMLQVDWLIDHGDSFTIPRFDRHNGQTAKNRAATNRRVADHRKCNDSTVTNVTPKPLQKPLPEKRREEKSILSSKEDNSALPFSSADFKLFWGNWEKHRKEKKQTLTPTARKQQLEKLQAMGELRAIAALKHSLANGWTGLFEPKQDTGSLNGHKPQSYLDRHPNQKHLEPTEENPL